MDLLGLRLVLDELEQLAAVDDLPGRAGHVLADVEQRRGSTCDGQPSLRAHVAEHVLRAADEAQAAGLEGPLQGRRVAEQRVGRSRGVGEDAGRERGLLLGAVVDRCRLDQLPDEALAQHVGWRTNQ